MAASRLPLSPLSKPLVRLLVSACLIPAALRRRRAFAAAAAAAAVAVVAAAAKASAVNSAVDWYRRFIETSRTGAAPPRQAKQKTSA